MALGIIGVNGGKIIALRSQILDESTNSSLDRRSGKIDREISYDLVLRIGEEAIMGGWIDFDGKSGRFCPGRPHFLSLKVPK